MRKSRLPSRQQSKLIELFVAGSTARAAAQLVRVNAKTAAFYFYRLRQIIELATADDTPFSGEVEVDESYFGGVRKGMSRKRMTSSEQAGVSARKWVNESSFMESPIVQPIESSVIPRMEVKRCS